MSPSLSRSGFARLSVRCGRRRRPRALLLAAALALAGAAAEGVARAEDPAAEALYQEGRRAVIAKDWALACQKFRESHDREPAPGTLLNLADCEENRGAWLEALAHFQSAERLFRAGDPRGAYAKQRALALDHRMPKLTLRLHPASPIGTVVERDGVPLGTPLLGSASPLVPGDHVVVVRAPGRLEVRTTIRLAEGDAREIEVAAGAPLPPGAAAVDAKVAAVPPATPPAAASAPLAAKVEPRSVESAPPSPLRTAGFVSLGVGAVGLGVGLISGFLTMNAKSTADQNCPATGCNQTGLDAESRGKTWSTASTAGFIVGGVGLAAGAGLLLFTPAKKVTGALSAVPLTGGAALSWRGSF